MESDTRPRAGEAQETANRFNASLRRGAVAIAWAAFEIPWKIAGTVPLSSFPEDVKTPTLFRMMLWDAKRSVLTIGLEEAEDLASIVRYAGSGMLPTMQYLRFPWPVEIAFPEELEELMYLDFWVVVSDHHGMHQKAFSEATAKVLAGELNTLPRQSSESASAPYSEASRIEPDRGGEEFIG